MARMLRCCVIFSMVLVLSASAATAQIFNQTTQKEVTGIGSAAPPPVVTNGIEVLWDITHGVSFDYQPSGRFSDMVAALAGYNFTTTNAGIDNVDLFDYQMLVICVGSTWNSAYTASEVAAATAYANGGGSILILGDNAESRPQNINPIAQAFGVTTGVTTIEPLDLTFSNLAAHPIFSGVSDLFFRAGGELRVAGPSVPVAWTDDGRFITLALSHEPCVVTLGDINIFAEYLGNADNLTFALNVFDWLYNCSPLPTEPSTWGKIKAIYR